MLPVVGYGYFLESPNTQVMFYIRESGLMFRTSAQFLFQMKFSRGAGGCAKCFWKFQRGGGFISLLTNGNSREMGGLI